MRPVAFRLLGRRRAAPPAFAFSQAPDLETKQLYETAC
jgi:hypothetical protein